MLLCLAGGGDGERLAIALAQDLAAVRGPHVERASPSARLHAVRGNARFATTRWSLVAEARRQGTQGGSALSDLCTAYWFPLYAFVRRRGRRHDDALDVTQSFFARLLEKGDLADVDQARGRFRSWLLASMTHFLSNEHDYRTAAKRDQRRLLPLEGGEERLLPEPSHDVTAEDLYARRWALQLLERAVGKLRDECAESQRRSDLFERVKHLLVGPEGEDPDYAPIAAELGMTVNALKQSVFRLRRRLGALVREEIAETVERPEDVDAELRELLSALGHVDPRGEAGRS